MLRSRNGFSLYTVISIIAFLSLIFILVLPQIFDVKKEEKLKLRYEQMTKIKEAVIQYMTDRNQPFTGDLFELVRTNYLNHAYESPFNGNGDKYIAEGNLETMEVTIKDPNEMEVPIPEKYKI
ncbi:MAG: hypothetical protein U9P79_08700 [Candidatus Cloacimonadota bacterium]|nr:hypothetical protein [Candidatus Cloacimonadota bacterium]